jgi:hypothetical protein
MNRQKLTYSFVATGSTTAIEFDNLDPPSDNSDGLDNVDSEEGRTARVYRFHVTAPVDAPGNVPLTFNLGGTAGGQTLVYCCRELKVATRRGALADFIPLAATRIV